MTGAISIRPSKDLRTHYAQISALSRENPVAITVNGKETDLTGSMTEQEKEIARLKRELRDTQDALAVLKKAISILSK